MDLLCSVEVLKRYRLDLLEGEENLLEADESAWFAGHARIELKIVLTSQFHLQELLKRNFLS